MNFATLRTSSAAIALIAACATAASAQETAAPATAPVPAPAYATGVTPYAPDFFARVQPSTAYDMVVLLPGFRLTEGDADVRGYSGSGGNVLIDGQRPPSKQETLETILKRIPASQVRRLELVRGGAAGADMQGYSLLANVVRDRSARLSGRIEAQDAWYDHGYSAPRLAGEVSYTAGDRTLDLTGAVYREIDDEHGFGRRDRFAEDGTPIRLVDYAQPEGNKIIDATAGYRQPLLGGTIRLSGLFKDTKMFADIGYDISLPSIEHIDATERNHTRVYEGAARYERPLGASSEMELLASYRSTTLDGIDQELRVDGNDRNLSYSDGSETILRGLYRKRTGPVTLELGAEGAINVLDSANGYFEDGVAIPLPNANVRVEEKRGEAFANASWVMSPKLTLEGNIRYEVSRIEQSGDTAMTKTLSFPKPRARLTWAPTRHDQLRLLAEREVGQLDFADFVGSASITGGTVTAGNRDLEPDSLWRVEASYEHRFGTGSIVIAARHEWVSDVVDHLPVFANGTVFDAVGNIGKGKRDEIEANLNLPLDGFGVRGVTVQANALWLRSSVTDPSTGRSRRISGDEPLEAKITVTHDIPAMNLRWGGSFAFAERETSYKVDEIEANVLRNRLDLFAEYKPTDRWTFRVFGKNLTDSAAVRSRDIYTGVRGSAPLAYREIRTLRSGRYFGLTIQRNFAG